MSVMRRHWASRQCLAIPQRVHCDPVEPGSSRRWLVAKVVKVVLPEWLLKWIGEVSEADETTLSEFLRRSAADRCERRDQEGSSRIPRSILIATRGARRGFPQGRLRRISEALGRATKTVDEIRVAEPIRSQLYSALLDLEVVTDLIFNQDVPLHGVPANDNDH